MFRDGFLRVISPKIFAWVFFYAFPVIIFIRFLVSTVFGLLILSSALYWLMWQFGFPKPFTSWQLLLWIDGLPTESKTSVITTLLTIIGFLIAFHTASLNWKAQALAELKKQVADEIETFYSEATNLTNEANNYVSYLVEVVEKIQSQNSPHEAQFSVNYALDRSSKFRAVRDRLSLMSVEVHRISGRKFLLLSTGWGVTKTLEDCAKAFGEITEKMWVHVPIISKDHPNLQGEFLSQVNVEECVKFSQCIDKNYNFINGNIGGVRGLLLSPIIGFKLSSIKSISGNKKQFTEALQAIRKFNP